MKAIYCKIYFQSLETLSIIILILHTTYAHKSIHIGLPKLSLDL